MTTRHSNSHPSQPSVGLAKPGFAEALQTWYQANARDLPWRNTSDPYAIWLSEIMLQQTQVTTVIPYYHRFLQQFPTLAALASAHEDAVLKAWEGLGYYSRARNLHKAAKTIVTQHGGHFPDTLAAVEALPGIGKSTAGAILTFSRLETTGQKHALLDGNVKRVLSRLYDVAEPVDKPAVISAMWAQSQALLAESEDAWTFNQAIMELGATLCTPKTPMCLVCPVKGYCQAAAGGTQHERPVKTAKKPSPHYDIGAAVIWHQGKILIQQRPKEGLLGGLWEFPGGKQESGETLEETVRREIAEELAITVEVDEKLATVKHAYTHFKITLHAYHCRFAGGTVTLHCGDAYAWVSPHELTRYAFPKANKKVIEAIRRQLAEGKLPGYAQSQLTEAVR